MVDTVSPDGTPADVGDGAGGSVNPFVVQPSSTAGSSQGSAQPGFIASRNIGGIIAEVTVYEEATDELEITSHPVETGAQITDHAFAQPSTVTIQVGWSDASDQAQGDCRNVYNQLLALQKGRQPIDIVTGKRSYSNMLIRSLMTRTDQGLEHALLITAVCRQIILVSTSTTAVPSNDDQALPQKTGGVQAQGSVQAAPANPNKSANAGALGDLLSA